ncbi:hypothetical protein HJG60_011282 [Phyllostomus discolor]|uniref:Uncharacterized protein n=1 Tax=Phyllostomus discolor TaxID=89673 RepID=A0A834A2F6_9CHIR|nr:hypothetical protein HJG60_011282 [Phyllostomus discolor]
MLYVGVGSERKQWYPLCSLLDPSPLYCFPQTNWALLVLIHMWVGLCTFQDPVGLSSELSCEAGSLSLGLNPHRCFQLVFHGLISRCWDPGLHGLSRPPVLLALSARERGTTGSASCLACSALLHSRLSAGSAHCHLVPRACQPLSVHPGSACCRLVCTG